MFGTCLNFLQLGDIFQANNFFFLLHCTHLAEPDRRLCAQSRHLTAALLSVTFPLTPRSFCPHTSLWQSSLCPETWPSLPLWAPPGCFLIFLHLLEPLDRCPGHSLTLPVLLLSGIKHIYTTWTKFKSVRNCKKWPLSWYSASLINTTDELWWSFSKDGCCLHPTMWDLVPSGGHKLTICHKLFILKYLKY